MKNYMDKSVVCPFYSQEEPQKLHCEGYSECTRFLTYFDSKDKKKEHKKCFCNDIAKYPNCPLYPVIMKQYEEKEDGDEDEQVS